MKCVIWLKIMHNISEPHKKVCNLCKNSSRSVNRELDEEKYWVIHLSAPNP